MNNEFAINAKRHGLYPLVNDTSIVGCTMGGLHLTTTMELNKFYKDENGTRTPNPHYGLITKKQIVNCHIATEKTVSMFESKINRKLKDAGSIEVYEVQDHPYADKLENSAIWVNRKNGQAYLRYFPNMQNKPNAQFFFEGKPIAYDSIKGKKPSRTRATVSKPDSEGKTVTVDKPEIRNVKVEHVDLANLLGGSHAPNAIA